ncbi:MAG: endonuclease/exonuclease/phosphatase family protein [Nitrospirae bacterium]|nr:endonuclease/exonuclease/phosphatase family protein [Candidatus Manganitrophaceae bacterium]
MTYNIHHGRGRDGRVNLKRICDVIQQGSPDLVALQEVDRGLTRSKRIDQGHELAALLEMHHVAGHNWFLGEGAYGNAFLSRWPVTVVGNLNLSVPGREPRGCLLTEVHLGSSLLLIASVHLGLGMAERKRQSLTILDQLRTLYTAAPILIMGDFNAISSSSVSRRFRTAYTDAFQEAGVGRRSTYRKGGIPLRLDYIYTSNHLLPLKAFVLRTELASIASDHFPLIAHFLLKDKDERSKNHHSGEELLSRCTGRSD